VYHAEVLQYLGCFFRFDDERRPVTALSTAQNRLLFTGDPCDCHPFLPKIPFVLYFESNLLPRIK
jgi:hypothetical protein